MIGVAIDYSAGLPGALAIKQAGYLGAVRYIGFPDRPKCTNRGELADFTAHDLGMALVFQNTTTDWQRGFTAGQANGRRGRDHANAIGFPAHRPIYMAIDRDIVYTDQFATVIEYLRGAGTTLGGPAATGVYGEADVIDRAREAGVATWFWQTAAWSRTRRTAANIYQKIGTVTVGGIACDVNEILTPDWGQHNAEDDMPTLDEIENMIKNKVLAGDWRFDGNRNPIDMQRQAVATGFENSVRLDTMLAKLDALTGELTDDETKIIAALSGVTGQILAAVKDIEGGAPTDEQVDRLAATLRAGLGDEVAEAIGQRLSRDITATNPVS